MQGLGFPVIYTGDTHGPSHGLALEASEDGNVLVPAARAGRPQTLRGKSIVQRTFDTKSPVEAKGRFLAVPAAVEREWAGSPSWPRCRRRRRTSCPRCRSMESWGSSTAGSSPSSRTTRRGPGVARRDRTGQALDQSPSFPSARGGGAVEAAD